MKHAKRLALLVTAGSLSLATEASARMHSFVGTWRVRISPIGDVDLVTTGIRPEGRITGGSRFRDAPVGTAPSPREVGPAQELATGKVESDALFVTWSTG